MQTEKHIEKKKKRIMKEITKAKSVNDFTSFQLYWDWICLASSSRCPKDLQIACPLAWQASWAAGSQMKATDMRRSCTYCCCHLAWKVHAFFAQGTKPLAPGHINSLQAGHSALAGNTYPSVGCSGLAENTHPPVVARPALAEDG